MLETTSMLFPGASTSYKKFYYTGIGSRNTPKDKLVEMTTIARVLEKNKWILRTGADEHGNPTRGADRAFFNGVEDPANVILYRAGDITKESTELMLSVHPAPERAMLYKNKKYLARNPFQVLGKNLNHPSKFLVCYCEPVHPGGECTGGTATTIAIAQLYAVPVFNLHDIDMITLFEKIKKLKH